MRADQRSRRLFCLLPLVLGLLAAGCGKVERAKTTRPAPDGTFFLIQQTAMSSSNGVIRLPLGTRLTRVSGDGANLTVRTDAGQEVTISRDVLTNDLDTAALIRKTDSDSRRELSERIKAEREATRAKNQKQ